MVTTKQLKDKLTKEKADTTPKPTDFLSTGSSLLDLAISGQVGGGFLKGQYHYLVGDSMSGKTFLSLTCLAEAAINHHFAEYRFIFDNAEDGALMDIEKFFGRSVSNRIEPPAMNKGGASIFSQTIEDFYYHVDDAIEDGRPFIYILDSMDSLSSKAEGKKFDEQKMAARKGKKVTGSYGDGKAKANSSNIRQIRNRLKATGSILIVISQTRANFDISYETRTRAGGKALTFYATWEVWSSCGKKIVKTVKGKPRAIGVNAILHVRKNRVTGRDRKVEVPIYYEMGFDDIGGCVSWLIEEEHWEETKKGMFDVSDLGIKGSETRIVRQIEEKGLEKDLKEVVQEVWDEIEEACKPKRKKRYE